jgi:tight adherence protein C
MVSLIPWVVAVAMLGLGWMLAPILLPSPLAGRARALRPATSRRALRQWPAWADRLAESIAARAPPQQLRDVAEAARRAGWGGPTAGARLFAAGWVLPVLLPIAGAAVVGGAADGVQAGAILLMLVFAGRLGPGLLAANMAMRRLEAMASTLPDAIDLLVICAESGLSLDVALSRSGRELAPAAPALAAELQITATELNLLPNRADAFANLARRVPLPTIQALTDMLVQTERFGTPLAQALRVLAAEYRTGRLMRAEEKAARLPAMMTVPMIAFILPPLFIVLIGPAVINALAR